MNYDEASRLGATEYRAKQNPVTLAIESSCDETAAALIRGAREVLSMSVYTQIPLHRKYGGVVPELASRSHVEKVGAVVSDALEQANLSLADVDAVAVTNGPGLVGALLVGLSYAKGLAYAMQKPLVGVDHIAGHIAANYLTFPALKPPFACLVASGGHSHIVLVEDYCRFSLLGKTRDDAAGEAFDKVARALGLPYPGGPALEALAREGDSAAFRFKAGLNDAQTFDFSFSGIKTAVVNLLHTASQRGRRSAARTWRPPSRRRSWTRSASAPWVRPKPPGSKRSRSRAAFPQTSRCARPCGRGRKPQTCASACPKCAFARTTPP